jgi:hypothetical protein
MAADQIQAVFKKLVPTGKCVWCEKDRTNLFWVTLQGSGFTEAHLCKGCLIRAITMQCRALGGPAQATSGNGAPTTAGRVS